MNGEPEIELTVRLLEDPGAGERVLRLLAAGGSPLPGTTVPDAEAAISAVESLGEDIFFPKPGPPMPCTQQYGGPQVAVVSGTFRGRSVEAEFKRTDGCEIARWHAMAPLLGGEGGA